MSTYQATIAWTRTAGERFTDGRYSRRHEWRFDGGARVIGAASPLHVPAPLTDLTGIDPEEAFVASISSCHMLWFLSIAAKHGFTVNGYHDDAVGTMGTDERGRVAITQVVLAPSVQYEGQEPDEKTSAELHHLAHEACFIANSVRSSVLVEPRR